MEPIVRTVTDNSWIFVTILSIIFLLGVSRIIFHTYFNTLGDLTLFVENQESFVPLGILVHMALASLIGIILLPFIKIDYHLLQWSTPLQGVVIIGIILLYFIVRFAINTILIYVLGIDEYYRNILKTKLYFRIFAIIGLVITSLFLYYSDFDSQIILYVSLAIIGLTLLLEYIFQLRKNGLGHIYISYYFILYLCILEILPVLYVLNHWSR